VSILSMGYLILFQEEISERLGRTTPLDFFMSIAGTVVTLELVRRNVGLTLPLIAIGFVAYGFAGPYIPGFLGHGGYTLERTLRYIWLSSEGVFGLAVGVMSSFLTIYILFGAFLEKTGGGKLFIALANLVTSRMRSGPGQSSVVASALFGTMSGSGVADVAAVGTFCIPVMKKAGYSPKFSAAIQGLSSMGAQIMPPVMGASAFIMAELTSTPYIKIAAMAVIPAILYYTCVASAVYFESMRIGLRPATSPGERAESRRVLRKSAVFFLPVGVLLYMLIDGYSPARSAFWAILSTIGASMVQKETRLKPKDYLEALGNRCPGFTHALVRLWVRGDHHLRGDDDGNRWKVRRIGCGAFWRKPPPGAGDNLDCLYHSGDRTAHRSILPFTGHSRRTFPGEIGASSLGSSLLHFFLRGHFGSFSPHGLGPFHGSGHC